MSLADLSAPRPMLARLLAFSLAVTAALLLFAAAPAMAQQRFSAIVVDVTPLRTKGGGPFGLSQYGLFADRTQQVMLQEARRIFAANLAPGDRHAPTLVIRIDAVQFGTGSSGEPNQSVIRVTDYMEGAALIIAGGKVIRQEPMLGAYENVMGPGLMFADNAGPRLQALCAFYAGWLKRKLGV
ncbi:hypothetical protein [Alsobacter sp. R-9]